jgi:hypothetical protein
MVRPALRKGIAGTGRDSLFVNPHMMSFCMDHSIIKPYLSPYEPTQGVNK